MAVKLRLDLRGRRLFMNEEEVPVTTRAYELLLLLAQQPGVALSWDDLAVKLWGYHDRSTLTSLRERVFRLRSAVPQLQITTLPWFGLRYDGPEMFIDKGEEHNHA